MGNPNLVVLFWLCYLRAKFSLRVYVDTVAPPWHVAANILRANGKTTRALRHPNGFDVWCFQLDFDSKK